jgi:hypothetical protein
MRALPGGILGQLTVNGAYPGYLVSFLGANGQAGFWTTLDTDFPWGGSTWVAGDLDVPSLIWDGTSVRPAKLVLGDYNGAWWIAARNGYFREAHVNIYQVYAAAANQAEFIWSGRVGDIARVNAVSGSPAVLLELTDGSAIDSAPRQRIQEIIADQYLVRAGTVFMIGGQQITINRPTSGAG